MSDNTVTMIADGAVTKNLVIKATGYSSTAGKEGPKGALSAAGTALNVGFALQTVATTLPFAMQTSGIFRHAVAGGAVVVGTDLYLAPDAAGKLVPAVDGDHYIAKLISINKGSATAAANDEMTVEICHGFLAANN